MPARIRAGINQNEYLKHNNNMISNIGFKNFRRFRDYTEVELGGVNMFVGGNNAGKSTVVKALLLMVDFLKNTKVTRRTAFETPKFYFNAPFVSIDTFKRAKNWNAGEKDELSFSLSIDHFDITLCLFDNSDDSMSYTDIKTIEIYDGETDTEFSFHLGVGAVSITFGLSKDFQNDSTDERSELVNYLFNELNTLEKSLDDILSNNQDGTDISELISAIATKKSQISSLKEQIEENSHNKKSTHISIKLPNQNKKMGGNFVANLVLCIIDYALSENTDAFTDKGKKNQKELKPFIASLRKTAEALEYSLENINIEYIFAHSATQKVLYNVKDNNDYLSQSIKVLYDLKITALSNVGKIMKGWLKEFVDIDSFKIVSASAVVKTNKSSKTTYTIGIGEGLAFAVKYQGQWHDLGDMGRGTIQLVVLFINLAIILKKYEKETIKPIVLVEEPEQNLHPAVQSKLADLFNTLNADYGLNLVIETHSEYMIRRVQVLMAKLFKTEPIETANIRVAYFPEEGSPYDMGYQKNGKFCKPFGTGFFNVADDASIELYEMEE